MPSDFVYEGLIASYPNAPEPPEGDPLYVDPLDPSIDGNAEPPLSSPGPTASIHADHYKAPYTLYRWENEYIYDSGNRQMPVAATTGSSRIVQLHAPTMQRVWSWEARRVGLPPILPAPEPKDDNETLLTARITPAAPTLIEDGTTLEYYVSGVYVFAMAEVVWYADGDGLPMGSMPWTALPATDNLLPVATFVTGLI